jgi:hypothetical protein
VPGKPVTDRQVRLFMQNRLRHSPRVAAARAGFSERTAGRNEADPRLLIGLDQRVSFARRARRRYVDRRLPLRWQGKQWKEKIR